MQKPRSFPLILRLGLIVGVLLATLSVGTTLLIRSSKAASAVASSPIVRTSVRDYWTTERMQNAIADSMPQVSTPSPTRSGTTTLAYSTEATSTEATPVSPVGNYATPPASYVGKIYFHRPGVSGDYTCSGTAIVSQNNSVVDTAGHCLYENGVWSTIVMFCPQYYNGKPPAGCWSEFQLYVSPFWFNNQSNYTHDLGMIVVQPLGQTTLVAGVGAADYYPNLPLATLQSLTVTAYGYPAVAPFNGEQMYSASGNITTADITGGTMLQISNDDMNAGASGGPWFVTYNGTIYLIGHHDSHNTAGALSPYYGDEWLTLLNFVQNAPNA
jgi:hypothetical protein